MSHSDADLAVALQQAVVDAGLLCGIGEVPAGGGWQGPAGTSNWVPYAIIWPTPGGFYEGSLCDHDDARPDYQTSSYGATAVQALFYERLVRDAILAADMTLPDRLVQNVKVEMMPGVIADYDVTPPIWHTPTRWRISTTAAA